MILDRSLHRLARSSLALFALLACSPADPSGDSPSGHGGDGVGANAGTGGVTGGGSGNTAGAGTGGSLGGAGAGGSGATGGSLGGAAGASSEGADGHGGTAGAGGDGAGGGASGSSGAAGAGGAGGGGGTPADPGNLFAEYLGKTQEEVDEKVTTAVNRFFGIGTGEPNTPTLNSGYRCYYELPNDPSMAYIWAADSNDVRSEGVSYGMMIAVQMDLKTEFDKLWKFAKTYMQYPANTGTTAWRYYFRWQGTVNGNTVNFGSTTVPAPDGDEYFAAALYLADQRWGSSGAVNYKQEADNISAAMLHNTATGDNRFPIIHTSQNMVVFVPYAGSNNFTDPSYHLPAFYELFALYGPSGDAAKWKSLATISRNYLVASAHPTTGLHPDYATFAGAPTTGSPGDGHDQFKYDAWRVVMNMAIDYAWFSQDPKMKAQVEKYHAFFANHLGTNNVTNALFHVDGSNPSGGGSTALTATLAAGALASDAENKHVYVQNLWNVPQQSGQYRYYQESVYLLGLLAVAGKYHYEF
jgi:oligosaccharide reducing-end xylanase